MIRFKVYRKGKLLKNMNLSGSHLFAQDEIPVRSQLDFHDGELLGLRHSDSAVGLVTLWEVERAGRIMLQTTRLPEKNESYNLNVELARGRLLRISQKREEWGAQDLTLNPKHQEWLDEALDAFIDALAWADKPEQAALAADKSLARALQASEAIALSHAESQLQRRIETQGVSRHGFGCSVDPQRINDKKYLQYIKDHFSFVSLPLTWRQIETKEHERNFQLMDEWIDWLGRNRIAIKVGPLINFLPLSVPDWLYIWENDFDQVREMAYDFITAVVSRYSHKVHAWNVVSSLNVENCFKFSFEQIIEMTRSSVLAARHAAPRSLIMVEVSEPWGDYYAFNQRAIPPLIYIDMICQGGVNFNALGVRLRFGRGGAGMQSRDMMEISHMLDRVGLFGKTVHLTNVQVPSAPDKRDRNGRIGEAGYWHEPWNETIQARWLKQAYILALSKPHIETITWQDLLDRDDGILQKGGLLRADFSPKPAIDKLIRLRDKLLGANQKRKSNKRHN